MVTKVGGFAPDLGLEYIGRDDGPAFTLPAQREAQLTGERVRHWVGELFPETSLERQLRDFASPHLSDTALLMPARFEAVVRDTARLLAAQAGREGHPALRRASALLAAELQLRDLLATYRSALLQA
jgi:hypothetical protein